jgi:hypothetical protein
MPRTVTHRRLAHRRSPEQAWSAARAHADGETGYPIDGLNGSLAIWLRLSLCSPPAGSATSTRLALPRQRGFEATPSRPAVSACWLQESGFRYQVLCLCAPAIAGEGIARIAGTGSAVARTARSWLSPHSGEPLPIAVASSPPASSRRKLAALAGLRWVVVRVAGGEGSSAASPRHSPMTLTRAALRCERWPLCLMRVAPEAESRRVPGGGPAAADQGAGSGVPLIVGLYERGCCAGQRVAPGR